MVLYRLGEKKCSVYAVPTLLHSEKSGATPGGRFLRFSSWRKWLKISGRGEGFEPPTPPVPNQVLGYAFQHPNMIGRPAARNLPAGWRRLNSEAAPIPGRSASLRAATFALCRRM